MCMFCRSLFVFLYFFPLALALSAFLQFTDSDNPFGIFKLFLAMYMCVIRRMSYKKNSLLTLREHLSSPAVFVGSMLLIFLCFSVILCFVCLRYVSCVPNVASVGGLFISDCLSVFYVCLNLPHFNDSACNKLVK
jgi:hypothetical protein